MSGLPGGAMRLYAAVPPDWAPIPIPHQPLPLGAVLVADLASGIPAVRSGIAARLSMPWCPLCLVVPATPVGTPVLQAMRHLPTQALLLDRSDRGREPTGDEIIETLRAAPPPGADDLTGYLSLRSGRHELAETLRNCFSVEEVSTGPSRSTVGRRLSDFGPLTARDWRAVARLILALHRPPHAGATVEQIAWAAGFDPRTLRESVTRYLGMQARDAADVPGWEWKLEIVLRRFGYVVSEAIREPRPRRSDEFQLV